MAVEVVNGESNPIQTKWVIEHKDTVILMEFPSIRLVLYNNNWLRWILCSNSTKPNQIELDSIPSHNRIIDWLERLPFKDLKTLKSYKLNCVWVASKQSKWFGVSVDLFLFETI